MATVIDIFSLRKRSNKRALQFRIFPLVIFLISASGGNKRKTTENEDLSRLTDDSESGS